MRLKMAQIKSWTVSDALWAKDKPLIPVVDWIEGRQYQCKPGAERDPMAARQVFSAIVSVLRTGIQWEALPRVFGSVNVVHQYFQNWQKAGGFLKLWQVGLAEYDGMQGIAWGWQSVHGALGKAPLAQECVGSNLTHRGKEWTQTKFVSRRP